MPQSSETEEVAAFSPEALIDWTFERCNRRFEHAVLAGDNDKAQAYNQRRGLLADFRNFAGAADEDVREQVTHKLNTMEDLSSCEGSPTRDLYESDDEKATRIEYRRMAMHALPGSMAMQLQGCGMSDDSGGSWFQFAFLSAWTLLLAIYSWYMLHNMNRYAYVPPPPMPSTLNVGSEPKVERNETSIEGLVTWTLVRVMRRLKSAKETGNIGRIMRFQQSEKRLESCFYHLPNASNVDKERIITLLSGEHELSDDDDSPFGAMSKMCDDEKAFHINSDAQTHRCILTLFELNKVEQILDLLHPFNDALALAPTPSNNPDG